MAEMTPKEALSLLNDVEFADKYQGKDEYTNMLLVCKEALEKQIPKKPVIKKSIKTNAFELRCPNCEVPLQADTPHCKNCGQALDWSGTNG